MHIEPDDIVATALETASEQGITRSEETLLPETLVAARAARAARGCAPLDKPELREAIENTRREREPPIDHLKLVQVTFSGFSEQAETEAKANYCRFCRLHNPR